jgi:hypothetical protein
MNFLIYNILRDDFRINLDEVRKQITLDDIYDFLNLSDEDFIRKIYDTGMNEDKYKVMFEQKFKNDNPKALINLVSKALNIQLYNPSGIKDEGRFKNKLSVENIYESMQQSKKPQIKPSHSKLAIDRKGLKKVSNLILQLTPIASNLSKNKFFGATTQNIDEIKSIYDELKYLFGFLDIIMHNDETQLTVLKASFNKLYNIVMTGISMWSPSYSGGSFSNPKSNNKFMNNSAYFYTPVQPPKTDYLYYL